MAVVWYGNANATTGQEKNMTQKQRSIRATVIGLVGTILTVCGGLAGAAITGAVTIYQTERQMQQVAVASSGGEQALSIDGGGIFVSRQEAAALDPELYFVDLDHGLALRRSLPGWGALEELTVAEQMSEGGAAASADPSLDEQPVYRIRYGQPIEIQADRETLVNGQPVPDEAVEVLEYLYGPEPWTLPYYSEVIVNIFDRSVVEALGMNDLPDFMLMAVPFSGGRANRLIAEEDRGFMVVQTSATYERARMAGQEKAFTRENWVLFAEAEAAYYIVEIVYIPQSDQPVQIWEDLQVYMDSFRVIR
jgi:hypothetical protein